MNPTLLITGFMASGKTAVAEGVAKLLCRELIDLDRFIEIRQGRSAHTIIDEDGENRFRMIETTALGEVLLGSEAKVIALGGGAWMQEENRALIARQQGLVVWLDTPFEVCWERIARDDGSRPLARHYENARLLFEERRSIYSKSDMRVDGGNGKTIDDIAREIVDLAAATGQSTKV